MYKKQMVFQKLACLLAVVAAAVCFVYSLGIMTDIYDSLYSTMMNPNDLTDTWVEGSIIYYDMQDFNKLFVNRSIMLILVACLLYLTNTQIRRRYYIGNFFAIGAFSVAAVAMTVWSHFEISAFKVQYLTTVDFEALKTFSQLWNKEYIESTFWFDLHYVVAALLIAAVAALLGSMVWKILLMREEKQLVESGKEAAV